VAASGVQIERQAPGVGRIADCQRQVAIGDNPGEAAVRAKHDQGPTPGRAHAAADIGQVHASRAGLWRLRHDLVNPHSVLLGARLACVDRLPCPFAFALVGEPFSAPARPPA
jgi:hypothetical protein